jgi:hypothetical protein
MDAKQNPEDEARDDDPLDPIPELAVVDLVRERDGRRELAVGVVLGVDTDDGSYTVEVVNTKGGRELIAASGRELRIRHLV